MKGTACLRLDALSTAREVSKKRAIFYVVRVVKKNSDLGKRGRSISFFKLFLFLQLIFFTNGNFQ